MDIIFRCTGCAQELSIDETGAGLQVNCPKCDTALTVPARSSSSAALKQTIPLMPFTPPEPGGRPAYSAPAAAPPPSPPPPAPPPPSSSHRAPPMTSRPGAPATTFQAPAPTTTVRAVITDFDMPLSAMTVLMLKWAIAALPAFSLLFFVGMLLWKLLGVIVGR